MRSADPEFVRELTAKLVGKRVAVTRLALNSLLVYLECEPGDDNGLVLWFEPTWHFRDKRRVLLGSRQAQTNPEDADDALHRIGRPLHRLIGTRVRAASIEPITNDLVVEFDEGRVVRTFAADPIDDEQWHISDNAAKKALYGNPRRLYVRKKWRRSER